MTDPEPCALDDGTSDNDDSPPPLKRMIHAAVDSCQDFDLLDLVFKLLACADITRL